MIKQSLISIIMISSVMSADSGRKEPSLFLEYEREASKQETSIESNTFKKMMAPITSLKSSAPVPTPVKSATPPPPLITKIESKSIGEDTHPYIVINKPINIESGSLCATEDKTNDNKAETKPSVIANLKSVKERVLAKAKEFLGTPYGFGNKNSSLTDCSGFTQQVYSQFGIKLPHSAAEQAQFGEKIALEDIQVGDLLFYRTYKEEPSHVGIYAGNGQIIHASFKSRQVQLDSIEKGYYKQRFMYAKRIALNEIKEN